MLSSDLKEVTSTLEQVVREALERSYASPSYASSVAGKLVSPIPLTHFPVVHCFYPRPLIKIMAPRRRAGFVPRPTPGKELEVPASEKDASNPFIYSPFGPGKKVDKRKEVLWVEMDPAEIALTIKVPS